MYNIYVDIQSRIEVVYHCTLFGHCWLKVVFEVIVEMMRKEGQE